MFNDLIKKKPKKKIPYAANTCTEKVWKASKGNLNCISCNKPLNGKGYCPDCNPSVITPYFWHIGGFDDILGPDKEDEKEPENTDGVHEGINQKIFEAYENSKKQWAEEERKQEEQEQNIQTIEEKLKKLEKKYNVEDVGC